MCRTLVTKILITFSFLYLPQQSEASQQYILDKVVVVARHGVRSPTDDRHYSQLTGQQWPIWNVPAGKLTGHGYAGMVDQGRYFREQWQSLGLKMLLNQGCPPANDISLWAAPDQRTKATGSALLDGLFPGCGIPISYSKRAEDPLFDSIKMHLSTPNTRLILAQVNEKIAERSPLSSYYHSAIALFRKTLCSTASTSCAFLDKPWAVTISKTGQVKLTGPLSHAASMAESVRLAYSENLPLSDVAFGHASQAKEISQLMALHAAKYDLVSDTPEYARQGGSLLMTQIINALTESPNPYTSRLSKPIVIFVGHDTNIAQLQTMLGFSWQLAEYPRNDIPPGGSLVFLRFHEVKTGKQFIQLSFVARSLDQWRSLTPLSSEHPLFEARYSQEGCFHYEGKLLCPLPGFIDHARQHILGQEIKTPLFE